jgi:hypothetical protein
MKREPKSFQVKDDPCIAEIYANKLIAASFDGGAVVITFGVTRFVPANRAEFPKRGRNLPVHVTGRLAISPVGAVEVF